MKEYSKTVERYRMVLGDRRINPVGLKLIYEHIKTGVLNQRQYLELIQYIREG